MVSDGGAGHGNCAVGAALHFGKIPGRRISSASTPRDHHRAILRSRHGAGRGHGFAQAREDHHRRAIGHDPGPRVDERDLRERREGPQSRAQGRRPHPDRDVDHQDGLRGRRATSALSENEARTRWRWRQQAASAPKSMAGSIEEIPLPDLLQLLSTSRKSGRAGGRSDAHVGQLFLRKGQIYFANLEDQASISPRKAIVADARVGAGDRSSSSLPTRPRWRRRWKSRPRRC